MYTLFNLNFIGEFTLKHDGYYINHNLKIYESLRIKQNTHIVNLKIESNISNIYDNLINSTTTNFNINNNFTNNPKTTSHATNKV